MDYRGIITRGYHVDAGGQNKLRIATKGYVGVLSEPAFVTSPRKIVFQLGKQIISFIAEDRIIK